MAVTRKYDKKSFWIKKRVAQILHTKNHNLINLKLIANLCQKT